MPTVFEPAADAGDMVAVRTTFRRDAARAAVVSRPALWERLDQSERVTVLSAPPGSGKTVLLRSWIDAAGLAERAAWVPVERGRAGSAAVLAGGAGRAASDGPGRG